LQRKTFLRRSSLFYNKLKLLIHRQLLKIPTRSKYKFLLKDWVHLKDLNACASVLETKRFSRNLKPVEMEYPKAKRILVIAPHYDDDVLGAGGTLTKAIRHGAEVHVLYVTNGSNDQDKRNLIYQKTKDVCHKFGVTPHFLGYANGKIEVNNETTNRQIGELIHKVRPCVIFTTFLLDDHDDHRRVNHLLQNVLTNHPLQDIEIWAYQIYTTVPPNVVVDITGFEQKKKDLLQIYKSVSGNRNWAHYILGLNAANCRYIGSREPVYAETFFVVPFQEYLELCSLYFKRPSSEIYYGKYYTKLSAKT